MRGSIANVDVNELIALQSELLKLSGNLNDIYDLLNSYMNELSYNWQDSQFYEFEENFAPVKEEARRIAESYEAWARGPLQRTIDVLIEKDNVPLG